jgi:hypothetical protein
MINPQFQDQRSAFETQFAGMSLSPFAYDDFETTRKRLVKEIHAHLTQREKHFLLSFNSGNPDWSLFPAERLAILPAVQWKLQNLQKLKANNPKKHQSQHEALEHVLKSNSTV